MIPPPFDYAAPSTLGEAIAVLGQNPEAKILAGGHSLLPMMKFRLSTPALLVDIGRIDGLDYIREDNGWLKIGAMTREAALEKSSLVRDRYPLLHDTSLVIADPLVRNMATVGGNLAHADPANDHPATMLAYGAQVVAHGPSGERTIAIADFFVGPFTNALEPNEILTEVRVPAPGPRSGGAYFKMERKVGDYAAAAVAVQLALNEAGAIASAGIGLTNVGLTSIKATAAESALTGQMPTDDILRRAAQLASEAAEPSSDSRGSADYKRSLVKTLTMRAVRKALARAQGN